MSINAENKGRMTVGAALVAALFTGAHQGRPYGRCAGLIEQTPGAEIRPGANHQFQFPK
jgi:hypothetical protein